MKKILLALIFVATFSSCTSDDNEDTQPEAEAEVETTIIGRWHSVGFEDTVMYVFTEAKRYTIYATDGVFGDLDTAIPNPNDWTYEEEKIVIDLNFGNFLIATPGFRCDGNVVDLVREDGTFSTLFRENFDMSTCNE